MLNEESLKSIKEKKSKFPFDYEFEGFLTTNKKIPEAATAYNEEKIRKLYELNGFDIIEPIHFGGWTGRKKFKSNQDMVFAQIKA